MLQSLRSELAAWSKLHKDVLAASHESCTSRVILVNILFRFLIFYDRICFSVEIPFQRCAGCHTSWEQQKVMAKTPREANLYGNWCVRKGLRIPWTHFCVHVKIICSKEWLREAWLRNTVQNTAYTKTTVSHTSSKGEGHVGTAWHDHSSNPRMVDRSIEDPKGFHIINIIEPAHEKGGGGVNFSKNDFFSFS